MKSSSIGDVAARFGVPTHALRHWEAVGLLQPPRDPAGRRRYGDADLTRIAVIVRSRAAGMSLDRIAVLLDRDADDRQRTLNAHIDELDRKMTEMQRWRAMTVHALECEAADVTTCPNFRAALDDLLDGRPTAFGRAGAHGHPGAALH